MDSTITSNQVRLWPENVEGLLKLNETGKLSLTFLANMTIRSALQTQQQKERAKAKQK